MKKSSTKKKRFEIEKIGDQIFIGYKYGGSGYISEVKETGANTKVATYYLELKEKQRIRSQAIIFLPTPMRQFPCANSNRNSLFNRQDAFLTNRESVLESIGKVYPCLRLYDISLIIVSVVFLSIYVYSFLSLVLLGTVLHEKLVQ